MIRYGILGPLSVAGDPVTARRDRIVLALLLLHAHRLVTHDELIEALWDERPPPTARGQLQTCISRLRRVLPAGSISTVPAGYRFAVGADEVDGAVFVRLAADGRTRGDAALLRDALDLWRGPALADIDSLAVRRAAAVWDERRMAAIEEWADLELAADRGRELLGELTALVDQFPLRERLRGQLMTALWRCGRQADALAEYQRARGVLSEELGLDPGSQLQDLHQRILTAQPSTPTPTAAPAALRVRCLPRTVGDFTGREATVERLLTVIDKADPSVPVIAVLNGMAGSGKTTLALHVASLVGDQFPDAHLFVDLHGHSTKRPLEPEAALLILLRQLGIPAERIPAPPAERVDLWRNELAGRRALVVLDNAASSAQLADLLPTAPGSLALVTGRRRLAGLDDVHPESLAVLGKAEAVALLTRIVGDRVRAEPEAAAEVVRHCGGLPLALRLAGSRLAHRPRWRVADLVRRLQTAPLPELAAENRSVATAFALSYGPLAEPAQRVFRLLGIYPGGSFDVLAVAALAGLPADEAQDALDDLVDVHLVEELAGSAYRMHDLLRQFAATLAAEMPADQRREALIGVLDLQFHAAAAAMPAGPREMVYRELGGPRPVRPDLVAGIADPATRFEAERSQLTAFVEAAASTEQPHYGWWIPRAAWWHLFFKGSSHELIPLFERAMAAAETIGDRAAIATAANYLASVEVRVGDARRARELLEMCIHLREQLGLRGELVSPLSNLAAVYDRLGQYVDVIAVVLRARRAAALAGERQRGRTGLMYLGQAALRLGRYDDGLYHYQLHYLHSIETGDQWTALTGLLGIVRLKFAQGAVTVGEAQRRMRLLWRRAVDNQLRPLEGEARNDLAWLLRLEGRFPEAMAAHKAAVAIARQVGDRCFEAEFLVEFARTCRAAGDPEQALELNRRAQRIAGPAGFAYEAACAAAGIAECLAATDPAAAERSWRIALAAFREMGVPEQAEVERRLAELQR